MFENFDLDDSIVEIIEAIERGERINSHQAIMLYKHAPLGVLGALATKRKIQSSGNHVYYNRNIHIEPTNICVFNCRFCSYRRTLTDDDAWYYDLDKISDIAKSYASRDITEVHIVGGVHPSHSLDEYIDMIRVVVEELPNVTVKAYTAVELYYIIQKSGLTLHEGLSRLKEAGMLAIPGGGAEIFDQDIRAQICPDKATAQEWLMTHQVAHEVGISTNATMLYGHIETIEHRIDHILRIRELQDKTSGFNAFIPLKFRAANNSMSSCGEVSVVEDMRMLALSRIFLDNVPHIKAYWVMLGKSATEMALAYGADDVDGTIDDTTKIYSMAGAEDQKPSMSVDELRDMICRAGYVPVERDTFYNPIQK